MEIVNKQHEEIVVRKMAPDKEFIKIHNSSEIYFSKGAIVKFGLDGGLYIHFMVDENMWAMFISDDISGFALSKRDKRATISIFNKSLIKLVTERFKIGIPSKFPLKLLPSKIKGHQVIEIQLNKPIEIKYSRAKNKKK
jgi:hypothetical protein